MARTELFVRQQAGGAFTVAGIDRYPGSIFFVHSGTGTDAAGYGQNPDAPVATVDYAVGLCTAAKGDVIVVLPGHAETVTATSLTLDISGITVICLGNGANAPVFTYGAAAATITVSAADVAWKGGRFIGNFDDVAAAFTIGAADDFKLDGAEFIDNSAILHFLSIVVTGATANAADGLTVVNCFWWGLAVAPNAFISVLGALDRLRIHGNHCDMAATNDVGHFLTIADKVIRAARIFRNQLNVVGATTAAVGLFITGSSTTNTGMVAYNLVTSLDTTTALLMTATINLAPHENYVSGVVANSGTLYPAADNPA